MRAESGLLRRFLNRFGPLEKKPVFILGNQKSGTSAIVNLLSAATGSSFTNDFKEMYEPAQGNLHAGRITLSKFIDQTRYPFSKEVIKEPSLTFLYPQLAQLYPAAQFVYIIRNPEDNIRSILNRVKMPGNLRIDDLRPFGLTPEWQKIVDSRWLGLEGSHCIEWLSHRWCLAADVYLKAKNKMFLLKYEDFLPNKIDQITMLAKDLGLNVKYDISSMVDLQFQPRGNSKVNKNSFFGDNLEVIHQICGARMSQFGYPTGRR